MCPLTLSQPSGLSFRLQKRQHISLSDRALHISDDGAAAVIHEVHTDLEPDQGSAQQTPQLSILNFNTISSFIFKTGKGRDTLVQFHLEILFIFF